MSQKVHNVQSAEIYTLRRTPAPPYVGFKALRALLVAFAESGIPDAVEPAMILGTSTVLGSQILTGLRFLGLLDDRNAPTSAMAEVVQAVRTTLWPRRLEEVLRSAYSPIFERNLASLSYEDFVDLFSRNYPGADDVQRKSRAFFLRAAQEANIAINSSIMRSIRTRVGSTEPVRAPNPSQSGTMKRGPRAASPSQPAISANDRKVSILLQEAIPNYRELHRSEKDAFLVVLGLLLERGQ
jgi:hypothetical protein